MQEIEPDFRWVENYFTFSLSPNKLNRWEIRLISWEEITLIFFCVISYAVWLSAMLSEGQNGKYTVNILRVKQKSTVWVFSVVILAPVFTQLIRTSDWDQNFGIRLVFGLNAMQTEQKSNPKSEVAHCQFWAVYINML